TVSALRSRTGMPPSRLPSIWCSSGYSNDRGSWLVPSLLRPLSLSALDPAQRTARFGLVRCEVRRSSERSRRFEWSEQTEVQDRRGRSENPRAVRPRVQVLGRGGLEGVDLEQR